MPDIHVYDNGGKTLDRYTVVINDAVYAMSEDATSPLGVNLYCGDFQPAGVGKEIPLLNLPLAVRLAIGKRTKL